MSHGQVLEEHCEPELRAEVQKPETLSQTRQDLQSNNLQAPTTRAWLFHLLKSFTPSQDIFLLKPKQVYFLGRIATTLQQYLCSITTLTAGPMLPLYSGMSPYYTT